MAEVSAKVFGYMNIDPDIVKFLKTARGRRMAREAKAARERDARHVKLAKITNGAHPDYKNGRPYAD